MKTVARIALVLAVLLLVMFAPAALFDQPQGTTHVVELTESVADIAIAGGLVALAYAAYMFAWKVLH